MKIAMVLSIGCIMICIGITCVSGTFFFGGIIFNILTLYICEKLNLWEDSDHPSPDMHQVREMLNKSGR